MITSLDKVDGDQDTHERRQRALRVIAAASVSSLTPNAVYTAAMRAITDDCAANGLDGVSVYVTNIAGVNAAAVIDAGTLNFECVAATQSTLVGKTITVRKDPSSTGGGDGPEPRSAASDTFGCLTTAVVHSGVYQVQQIDGTSAAATTLVPHTVPDRTASAVVVPIIDYTNLAVEHGLVGTVGIDTLTVTDPTHIEIPPHVLKFVEGVARSLADCLNILTHRRDLLTVALASCDVITRMGGGVDAVCAVDIYLAITTTDSIEPVLFRTQCATGEGVHTTAVRNTLPNAYLFRSAELGDVTSAKRGMHCHTCFPVHGRGSSSVLLVDVTGVSRARLTPRAEQDIRKVCCIPHPVFQIRALVTDPPMFPVTW